MITNEEILKKWQVKKPECALAPKKDVWQNNFPITIE